MEKSYEPAAIESKWYAAWETAGDFKPHGEGTPYCILLPPPNVTGTLHMGHAFQQTVMDALSRYHRMRGFRTLWQGGTDHAGIATQKIVENQLAAQGKSRHDLGATPAEARKAFVERVWDWKHQSGSTITHQMRRLGASVDWSRERFTMDEGLSAAVRRVFVQWYRDGLIYRGRRLVNWDPVLMTAVSDLEVNSEEKDGSLWLIRYPASDGGEGVVVATTRPETMLGDVAVAVHPEDERYRALIGKTVRLPLCDRDIPVIADDYVDREFGTGAVKITPAHDFNDYQVWQRHKDKELKSSPFGGLINVLTFDGKIKWSFFQDNLLPSSTSIVQNDGSLLMDNGVVLAEGGNLFSGPSVKDLVPPKYQRLDRFLARKAVLADLEAAGLLVETKKHKLQVPVSQRSDAVIEPMLTDQWFLDLTSETRVDGKRDPDGKPLPGGRKAITEPALEAVRGGAIKFVPENWSTTYTQWLDNIQDWCVSRQLWWGHQIPAWYDKDGNTYVGENEEDLLTYYPQLARASDGTILPELHRDNDVLDTWFSSALWPFSTMGWPANGPVSENGHVVADWAIDQQFLPSAVLVTGFDIIFFWVARMVMATQYFVGRRADGSYEPGRENPADRIPFREVYINAIVRDAEGQKMSKSKGNTIDPLDLIDGISLDGLVQKSTASLLIPQVREKVEKRIRKDYPDGIAAVGADALRFTFAALATYGRTINFDLKRAEGYRHFCNKLWNAARFVLMNCEGFSVPAQAKLALATEAERWIVSRLAAMLAEVESQFALYRFDLAAQALYEFVWNEYCDWFLELAKPALADADAAAAQSTRHTLVYVLEAVLRALHPITPFITAEIWVSVAPLLALAENSVTRRPYPRAGDLPPADAAATAEIEWLRDVLTQLRRIRSEMNIAPAKVIPLLFANGNAIDRARAQKFGAQIAFLAKTESQRWIAPTEAEPAAAAAIVGEMKVLIPLAGLIDLGAEKLRLDKEIKRLDAEMLKSNAKLANFGPKTPPAVVEQEKARIADFTTTIAALREQLVRLDKA